jgi:hypothetical protein
LRDIPTRETTSLNHNLRRIIYYTPYSEPVWPKCRNTVRMFCFFLNGYVNQKRFTQWDLKAKTIQFRRLPIRFTSSTLRFDSPRGLFDYLPEPIKEDSFLSRESQQRPPPLPMRSPPDSKAYAAEVYPIPTCDVMRQLSKSLKLLSCP